MGTRSAKPDAGKKPHPKRAVVVSDAVRVVMAGLTPAEKDTIEDAFKSSAALLRLPVGLVVAAPSGDRYTARVTDDLRLIYQMKPDHIEVVLLLSAGAVAYLTEPNLVSGSNGKPGL